MCEDCPVRAEFLETAMADASIVGRGGTTEAERREMRRGAMA